MTNLSMVAAVIDVARARPARPLREFFQRPQMPIREMYLYRFLVNLTWYARNYMNIVLVYIFASALFYPLFLLNLASAGLLHFVCVGLRESPKDAKKTATTTTDLSSQASLGSDKNSSNNLIMAQSSKMALRAVSRSIVKGLHETADNFLKAASGRELDTPVTPSKDSGSDSSVGSPLGGTQMDANFTSRVVDGTALATFTDSQGMMDGTEEVIKRQVPKLQMSELHKLETVVSPAPHHHPKKSHHQHVHKKHTRRSIVFKFVQLLCCCVVFWSYGVGVCFIATLIPVFIICLHAVLTPYGDEASEFFENAARSRGTEIEAPSTPVQAFQGKQETSFSATREKFEKQVARPPTMNPPHLETSVDGHQTPTSANDGSESPLKTTVPHAHSTSDILHLRSQNPNKGSGYPRLAASDDMDSYSRSSSNRHPHQSSRSPRKHFAPPTSSPTSMSLSSIAFPMSYSRSSKPSGGGGGSALGSTILGFPPNSSSPTTSAPPPFSMEPRSIS